MEVAIFVAVVLFALWRYMSSEKYKAKVRQKQEEHERAQEREKERKRKLFTEGGPSALLDDAIKRYALEGWRLECHSGTLAQLERLRSRRREGILLEANGEGGLSATANLSLGTQRQYHKKGFPHERIA